MKKDESVRPTFVMRHQYARSHRSIQLEKATLHSIRYFHMFVLPLVSVHKNERDQMFGPLMKRST
jgi:hypothetical protein